MPSSQEENLENFDGHYFFIQFTLNDRLPIIHNIKKSYTKLQTHNVYNFFDEV